MKSPLTHGTEKVNLEGWTRVAVTERWRTLTYEKQGVTKQGTILSEVGPRGSVNPSVGRQGVEW